MAFGITHSCKKNLNLQRFPLDQFFIHLLGEVESLTVCDKSHRLGNQSNCVSPDEKPRFPEIKKILDARQERLTFLAKYL
jgi:hypothetical protein